MSARCLSLALAICSAGWLPVEAQVVQLPTFHFFAVNTSVSVPDSGGTLLGGVGGSSLGRQQFAPPWLPSQSARGLTMAGSGAGVTATIHDLSGPATSASAAHPSAEQQFRDRLDSASRNQLPRGAGVRQAATARNDQEARRFLAQGDRARAAGKPDVAKIYYGMAARRAQGDLAGIVSDRLAALDSAPSRSGSD